MFAPLLLAALTVPAGGFRCGNELINLGDRPYDVRRRCGPATATYRTQDHRPTAPCTPYNPCFTTVTIDLWVYDLAPGRFTRHLTFENGRLTSIETGDRTR